MQRDVRHWFGEYQLVLWGRTPSDSEGCVCAVAASADRSCGMHVAVRALTSCCLPLANLFLNMLHARFETWTLVRHALWTFLAIVDFFIGWFECTYACGVRLVTSDELRFGFERIFYFGFIRVLLLVTRSSPLYINFWRFAAESRFFVSLYCRKMLFSH